MGGTVDRTYDSLLAELLDRLDSAPAESMLDESFEILREGLELRHRARLVLPGGTEGDVACPVG